MRGDAANDLIEFVGDPNVFDSGVEGVYRPEQPGAADAAASGGHDRPEELRDLPGAAPTQRQHRCTRSKDKQGEHDLMSAKGFFTDTTLCIGCKACEVACKQWNQLPDDGFFFTGMSYDNTVSARRFHLAARRVYRTAGAADADRTRRLFLAVFVRCLQTLRARRVP